MISACVGAPFCAQRARRDAERGRASWPRLAGPVPRTHLSGCERRCGAPNHDHLELVAPWLSSRPGATTTSATPTEIYRRSFATIRAEADLGALPPDAPGGRGPDDPRHRRGRAGRRPGLPPRLVGTARDALRAGAPIFTDAQMIASGITRRRLPADNAVRCLLHDDRTPGLAHRWGTTRSAAAVSLWGEELEGAVVAIGNAPTALFHLLELIADGGPRPAAIIGIPVGFVGSAESKVALAGEPVGPALPGGPRPPRRLGAVRRRGERAGPGGGDLMTGTPVRGRGRTRRPGAAHPQGGPADQRTPPWSPTTPAPTAGRSPGRSWPT